jgi:hypothetical protein
MIGENKDRVMISLDKALAEWAEKRGQDWERSTSWVIARAMDQFRKRIEYDRERSRKKRQRRAA